MDITKVLEMLGVDKLDESKQTEIQDTLSTIIESKAVELSETKVEEAIASEKEKLVEEFETKFEDYKEDVTSKFSNFVDSILEEEMQIPEKIVKYARLGELYEDLIDQFKIRLAIDEGKLDEEVKSTLKEAKEEVESLRDEVNSLTGSKLQLEQDNTEMATHIHLRKKCDGLTESQKKSVLSILEGASKEEIDRKFEVVLESLNIKKVNEMEDEEEEEEEEDEKMDEESEEEEDEKDEKKKKKVDEEDDEDEDEEEDKSKTKINKDETNESTTEVDSETKQKMNESSRANPMMETWKKMLRENKF